MGKFRKLGRHAAHRVSMLRTMVSQLVKHERIETTVAKVRLSIASSPRRCGARRIRWCSSAKMVHWMRQDVLLLLFGEMMLSISYLQSWPTATKIELVDTRDCCELGYELEMLHRWHTLSLWTERTNSERQNLQRHHHLSELHLIHGLSLVLANNGQDLKLARVRNQKAYESIVSAAFYFLVNENTHFVCRSLPGTRLVMLEDLCHGINCQ
ncbi:hypothetical protein ACQ4PT_005680 [Festuca glaucescens]